MKSKASNPEEFLARYYGKLPFQEYSLLDRAVRTLLVNVGDNRKAPLPWAPRRGIMPSAIGFPGVWNWDCAFHAVGASYFDTALGRDQIDIFLDLQKESGLFPDVWRADGRLIDQFGKPPVIPWAAWRVYEQDRDRAFLQRAFQGSVKNEAFWMRERGGELDGLFHYSSDESETEEGLLGAKYESGWDNSVRWDDGILSVWPIDLNCFMIMLYRALAKMAEELGEEAAEFKMREAKLATRINEQLWDERRQTYLDYDFEKHAFVNVLTPASFMPLYINIASTEQAAAMAVQAKRLAPGWPTVSYDHPAFEPTAYWRGRTWYNVAYFALKGLKNYGYDEIADAGRRQLLTWAHKSSDALYENYHSETGEPVGCRQFSWTAVFVMEFILNWTS
jgi:putative isomerase